MPKSESTIIRSKHTMFLYQCVLCTHPIELLRAKLSHARNKNAQLMISFKWKRQKKEFVWDPETARNAGFIEKSHIYYGFSTIERRLDHFHVRLYYQFTVNVEFVWCGPECTSWLYSLIQDRKYRNPTVITKESNTFHYYQEKWKIVFYSQRKQSKA